VQLRFDRDIASRSSTAASDPNVPIEEVAGAVKITDSGGQGSRIKKMLAAWRGVNYDIGGFIYPLNGSDR
jgi:hypothetical protein